MSTVQNTPEPTTDLRNYLAGIGAIGGSRRTPAQVAWTNRLQKIGVEAKKKKAARKAARAARKRNRKIK